MQTIAFEHVMLSSMFPCDGNMLHVNLPNQVTVAIATGWGRAYQINNQAIIMGLVPEAKAFPIQHFLTLDY